MQADLGTRVGLVPNRGDDKIDPSPECGYYPDRAAILDALDVERTHLQMPRFTGMTDVAMTSDAPLSVGSAISDPALRSVYFDAFIDLHKLIEEYRFHVVFAHVIAVDIGTKIERGEAEEREPQHPFFEEFGLPDESRVLLLPFFREPPSAVSFFDDPHVLMTGGRRLSAWFAGQLTDSALIRGVAACDRVATMLWARAGQPLPKRRDGTEFLPEFSDRRLARLDGAYGNRPEWEQVEALATHTLFTVVRGIRDGFTHTRRIASELHGELAISRLVGAPTRGMDAGTHLALSVAFYNLIVFPLIDLAGALLAEDKEQDVGPGNQPVD
jgi:hypothetical protein